MLLVFIPYYLSNCKSKKKMKKIQIVVGKKRKEASISVLGRINTIRIRS
jgi:hypothetical protein